MAQPSHDLSYQQHCDNLGAELWTLAATVDRADPDIPVRTCGGWTLRMLVEHTGHVHRWAAAIVGKLSPRRLYRKAADWPLPTDPADWSAWLTASGRELMEVLHDAEPAAPVWAWGADQHVRFWARRMLHETTVHRCDAQLALGVPTPVDPEVAVDGIDEFLDNLPHAANFAPGVLNLRGDPATLRLAAPDQGAVWSVTLHEEGFTWSHESPFGGADAAVTADATDLYLFIWGRIRPGDPRILADGDPALLQHWITHSAV